MGAKADAPVLSAPGVLSPWLGYLRHARSSAVAPGPPLSLAVIGAGAKTGVVNEATTIACCRWLGDQHLGTALAVNLRNRPCREGRRFDSSLSEPSLPLAGGLCDPNGTPSLSHAARLVRPDL